MPEIRGVVYWLLCACWALAACHRPSLLPKVDELSSEAEQARELTRAGRPLEAFERLAAIIKERPGDLAAHRWYVEAAAEAGRLDDAADHYRRLQSGSGAPQAAYGLGLIEAARGAGHLESALKHLAEASRALPQEPDVPYRMGLLRLLNSENEPAAELFRRALERDQNHCEARVALAEASTRLSRRTEALEALRPLLDLPCSARVMDRARTVAARLFNPTRASEPDALPQLDRIMELLQQDLVQQALSLADRLLDRFPRDPFALTLRGIAHSRLENYGEAICAFEEALKIQPDNLSAMLGLGDIYFRLERWEKARGFYEQAVTLNPLDAQSCQRLGDLAGVKKDHRLASHWYGRMVRLAPQDLALRHKYALSLFQAQDYPQAISVYEENLQLKPDDLESLVRLGSLYSALSRTQAEQKEERREKAIRYLEEAQRLNPENQAVREMLEKIKEGK